MKITKVSDENTQPQSFVDDVFKTKPNLRQQYVLEKERIKHEIGDLEQIRETLGLSQRRLCRLLLVDPSAWTRWSKTGAPPHIYQALRWLIQLKQVNPEAVLPSDISSRVDFIQSNTQNKIKELENNIAMLERALSAKVALASQAQVAPAAPSAISEFAIKTALRAHEQHFQNEITNLEARIQQLLIRRPTKKRPKKRRVKKSGKRAVKGKTSFKKKSKKPKKKLSKRHRR